MSEEEIVRKIVREVLGKIQSEESSVNNYISANFNESEKSKEGRLMEMNADSAKSGKTIVCNYSGRHCHISREDLDILYGKGYELTKMKDLIQPGEFASNEFVTMVGPTGETLKVRILGPVRKRTQVEISRTDSFAIKIKNVPVRESGDVAGSPGCVFVGPKGAVTLNEGVIIAMRHIHFTTADAEYFGVKDKEILKVRLESPNRRSLIFDDVVARVNPNYALEMHIDSDEANAAGVNQGTPAVIIKG